MSQVIGGADAVLQVLAQVEDLPSAATGALVFGDAPQISGVVLLEKGRVCWATAHGMRYRLTDLLRERCEPPLNVQEMERVFSDCKQRGQPVGEALVAGGLVEPGQLRDALLQHTAESLASSTCWNIVPRWVEHRARGYQSSFTFLPLELIEYASRVARGQDRVGTAQARLEAVAGERASAVFDGVGEVLLACHLANGTCLRELRAAGAWASQSLLDQGERSAVLKFVSDLRGGHWMGWRNEGLSYLVHCVDRADFSVLVRRLLQQGWTSAVQSSVPLPNLTPSPT